MKRNIMRSLSAILAVLLAMTFSFAVLAESSDVSVEDESVESADISAEEVSGEDSANESAEVSAEASDASDASDASAEESKEASKEESAETSKESTDNVGNNAAAPIATPEDNFPWARVITLIVIVVLIVAAIILSKTNTAIGQKLNKFFKEYLSEIKKVSWYSPKDTMKATGVVLVFIVGAAIAIGLLDFGFTKLVQLLADIF